jgi:hypothetical protein
MAVRMMIPIIGGHAAVSRAFAPSIIAKADDRNDRECRECDDNYDGFHIINLTDNGRRSLQPILFHEKSLSRTKFTVHRFIPGTPLELGTFRPSVKPAP